MELTAAAFAPVCRRQSIGMMLAIAVGLGYDMFILDVQTAFLNADVEEDVLVKNVTAMKPPISPEYLWS